MGGKREGLAHEAIGETIAIGRIGDNVFAARDFAFEKVEPGLAVPVVGKIGCKDLIAGAHDLFGHPAFPAGTFPDGAVEAFGVEESARGGGWRRIILVWRPVWGEPGPAGKAAGRADLLAIEAHANPRSFDVTGLRKMTPAPARPNPSGTTSRRMIAPLPDFRAHTAPHSTGLESFSPVSSRPMTAEKETRWVGRAFWEVLMMRSFLVIATA
ncbi:hypothetical protein W911_04715 [Hyphomicrobium nitrativorans NL23]|uniref:Uncharacterized protein n=1 Tax=Hyphomicrobium nitrativorans NL23 TaxID=1029756 RepID=V5SGG8_9HYPH|nr:hypothetical protein W911_04715 [Hyphomicrobium nitrativorans NL23]